MTTQEFVDKYEPCVQAIVFIEKCGSLSSAWDLCDRPQWLLWCARQMELCSKKDYVRIACLIARNVLRFVPSEEHRPRLAIEAAEKWIEDPSEENMAYAAAHAAHAAAYAANADANAADAAHAAHAAAYAANAAANAADAADAADAAAYAAADAADAVAHDAERNTQCNIIRSVIKNPFK